MNKEMTRKELQGCLLDILSSIDAFCSINSIRYSLGGGTLLGAVRHKGFIPWDDDIDIMMPRPDYDKFKLTFNSYSDNYKFIYAEKTETVDTPHAYGKVHDVRTKIFEGDSPTNKSGVYVDVFPIDGMPQKEWVCKLYMKIVTQLVQILYYKNHKLSMIPTFAGKVKHIFSLMFTYKQLGMFNDKIISIFNYTESKYAGAITGVYGMKERYQKDIFEHYTRITFEDREYCAIEDFDCYLKQHYKNYMQIPPEDKRINHQSTAWWINTKYINVM